MFAEAADATPKHAAVWTAEISATCIVLAQIVANGRRRGVWMLLTLTVHTEPEVTTVARGEVSAVRTRFTEEATGCRRLGCGDLLALSLDTSPNVATVVTAIDLAIAGIVTLVDFKATCGRRHCFNLNTALLVADTHKAPIGTVEPLTIIIARTFGGKTANRCLWVFHSHTGAVATDADLTTIS